jgi:hypothetical protein
LMSSLLVVQIVDETKPVNNQTGTKSVPIAVKSKSRFIKQSLENLSK